MPSRKGPRAKVIWLLSLALVCSGPSASAGELETVDGVFGAYVEDHFDTRTSTVHYSLTTADGNVELVFPAGDAGRDIPIGSRIRVSGRRSGRHFEVESKLLSTAAAPSPLLPARGVRRIGVFLVTFQNISMKPIDKPTTEAAMQSVNSYFQENSYGNLSTTSTVYDYVKLPINEFCGDGDFDAITGAAVSAEKNAGVDLSQFDTLMFIGPP